MNRTSLLLSGLVLFSQALSLPSVVRSSITGLPAPEFHLQYPLWHLVFTPFSSTADLLTCLSAKQLYAALIALLLVIAFLIKGWRSKAAAFLGLLALVAWGALLDRPAGKLVANDISTLLVDFHSHSQRSHDGRPSFTPERNRRWHRAQGYGAGFITDHNRVDGALEAYGASLKDWHDFGYRSLRGEEISLQRTHLVVLGVSERIDNQPYDGDYAKIGSFIGDMKKQNRPVIASLPEYWWYHWGPGMDQLIAWGISGIEIVNCAPKALDFPTDYREQVIALARKNNLFLTGISDNHGYGSATAVWTAMNLPGWRDMDPDRLEKAILMKLREGFSSTQVLERTIYRPQSGPELAAFPIVQSLVYWRSLDPWQAVSWSLWVGLMALLRRYFYGRKN